MKNWGYSVIYPNRHWVVLENNCQFTGFLVSELSSCAWSIPYLIGLVERQNLSLPNEVKDLRYLLSQCFCAISVQLYHLIPAIFIYLPGNLNLELGCKEAWRIHTCGIAAMEARCTVRAEVAKVLVVVSYEW